MDDGPVTKEQVLSLLHSNDPELQARMVKRIVRASIDEALGPATQAEVSEKATKVLREMAAAFVAKGYEAIRWEHVDSEEFIFPSFDHACEHAHWMCVEALTFLDSWSGSEAEPAHLLAQGVLWLSCTKTVHQMKRMNEP